MKQISLILTKLIILFTLLSYVQMFYFGTQYFIRTHPKVIYQDRNIVVEKIVEKEKECKVEDLSTVELEKLYTY